MANDQTSEGDGRPDSGGRGPDRSGRGDPTTAELDAIAWNLPRARDAGPGGDAAEPKSSTSAD